MKLNNILLLIAMTIAGFYIYKSTMNEGRFKTSFPNTQTVIGSSFSCQALIDTSMTGSNNESLTKGIEAIASKGTNKLSLQIKDPKTVTFLSGASFNNGDAVGTDFSIIKSDENELVAALWNDNSMNSVTLNKRNGLLIWSKIRSEFPGYGAPAGDMSYMLCR